jgi:hypothetical protein
MGQRTGLDLADCSKAGQRPILTGPDSQPSSRDEFANDAASVALAHHGPGSWERTRERVRQKTRSRCDPVPV